MSPFSAVLTVIFIICSAFLLIVGLHHYIMLGFFWRARRRCTPEAEMESLPERLREVADDDLPVVLTQLPLYNERNVAERVIRKTAAIDYPREKHIIQVLDDSTDDTVKIVDRVVAELVAEGARIELVRRADRVGYKAGALDYGLSQCGAPFVAIFDADFEPPVDFLRRTVPHLLADEKCGLVQARWGSMNAEETPMTKAQSMGIDGHFVVEQVARSYNGLFLNFNGTAGVWRREAIDDAGGWSADTLTEDLELSYRAQFRGWTFHYLPHLVVPAEIPATYQAFRQQQFRWAKGSMQVAKMMLPRVWKSDIGLVRKVECTFHLLHYGIHICMALHLLLGLPIVLLGTSLSALATTWYLAPLGFAMVGPSLLYLAAQLWLDRGRFVQFFQRLPMLMLLGFGICVSNARACAEGLAGVVSPFVRTPKKGDGKTSYRIKAGWIPKLELGLAVYAGVTALTYWQSGQEATAGFFSLYAGGLALFGLQSHIGERV